MDNRWCNIKNNLIARKYTLCSIAIGCMFFAVLYILTKIFNCSLCIIKNLLGFSCFGCGMTRAFIYILKLDFVSAIRYNVLSVPLFVGILFYVVLFTIDIFLNKNYIKILEKFLSKKYMYIIYFVILLISAILNNLL